jgi:hypothetical protein
MAHFAKIENNIVTSVIVIDDKDCDYQPFPDSEPIGQAAIANFGLDGLWLQTSYNTIAGVHPNNLGFRKNFAGIGFSYDSALDAFVEPKPYPSWVLNTETCLYGPPIPQPEMSLFWDETNLSWVIQEQEDDAE